MNETNLKTLIRQKRSSFFVGRSEECDLFETFLLKSEICLLNIYGVGGVGKSTLLEQYLTICKNKRFIAGILDGKESSLTIAIIEGQRVYSAIKMLESLVQQLCFNNKYEHIFKAFQDEIHDLYHLIAKLERVELEEDTSAMVATSREFFAQAAGGVVGAVVGNIPGAIIGAAIGSVSEQAVEKIGRTARNLRRYKLSKDDIERCLHAEKKITSLFINAVNQLAISQQKKIVLLFDTYEEMGSTDAWIRNFLLPSLSSRIFTVIAGRDPLSDKWNDWVEVTKKWELRSLPEDDARKYLSKRGITDMTMINSMLSLTGRLPWALTLITDIKGEDHLTLQKLSTFPSLGRRVVERFFSQIIDENMREVIEACSLTVTFDADLLSEMLGKNVHQYFKHLQQFSFFEVNSEGRFSLSDPFREFVFDKVRQERPSTVFQWNQKARQYYENLLKISPVDDIPVLAWSYLHHRYLGDEEARTLIVGAKIRKGIVEIRPAREADLQGILQVDWAAFSSPEDRFQLEQIQDLFRINSDIFTVARDLETGIIVGYSCVVPMKRAFALKFEEGNLDIQDVLAPTVLPDTAKPPIIDYMLDSLVLRDPHELYIGALLIRYLGRQLSRTRKLYSVVSSEYGRKLMKKLNFKHTGDLEFDNKVVHEFYVSCLYDSTNPSPIVNILPKEAIAMENICSDCLYTWCHEWDRHVERKHRINVDH